MIQATIEARLFKGKAVLIFGARRVGKTTLAKDIMAQFPGESTYFSCDEVSVRLALSRQSSTQLRRFIGNHKLVIIDEAQRVPDIGLTLKILIDTYPDIQIIATGSSSFDLANLTSEPLTGRAYEYTLYPLSLAELQQNHHPLELDDLIPHLLVYGSYPDAALATSDSEAGEIISGIAEKYLYRDILAFETLRNPELLEKLLQALAFQVGGEVSYDELARMLKVNSRTIERYIHLLEQAFIIFRLTPLSRNPRKEIVKSRKIYFYDLGVRNSLIRNFNSPHLRNDIGALWENFCIVEMMKKYGNQSQRVNTYFWRNYIGAEVDFVVEYDGILHAYECTWGSAKKRVPAAFAEGYPGSTFEVMSRERALDILL
jgi:predicted AAA+ superfamily ATPase